MASTISYDIFGRTMYEFLGRFEKSHMTNGIIQLRSFYVESIKLGKKSR